MRGLGPCIPPNGNEPNSIIGARRLGLQVEVSPRQADRRCIRGLAQDPGRQRFKQRNETAKEPSVYGSGAYGLSGRSLRWLCHRSYYAQFVGKWRNGCHRASANPAAPRPWRSRCLWQHAPGEAAGIPPGDDGPGDGRHESPRSHGGVPPTSAPVRTGCALAWPAPRGSDQPRGGAGSAQGVLQDDRVRDPSSFEGLHRDQGRGEQE